MMEVYGIEAAAERLGMTKREVQQSIGVCVFYPAVVLEGYEEATRSGTLEQWLKKRYDVIEKENKKWEKLRAKKRK